ncbi:NEDD8-conjugating enzyme Ubc12 [Trichonephila clavipes]|nr:NEDD8-conjugating enzyme Ubc12 [Trichonephila clavipes]
MMFKVLFFVLLVVSRSFWTQINQQRPRHTFRRQKYETKPNTIRFKIKTNGLTSTRCRVNGFYRGGCFTFSFRVSPNYPHEPPKVKCETMVYHPNIDLDGNVCLNILREDWKPVLTINSIVYGLQYLFLEPNPEDPLNKEAAEVLQNNRRIFEQNVRKAMNGGYIGSTCFERCLK